MALISAFHLLAFQSTLPARGATWATIGATFANK